MVTYIQSPSNYLNTFFRNSSYRDKNNSIASSDYDGSTTTRSADSGKLAKVDVVKIEVIPDALNSSSKAAPQLHKKKPLDMVKRGKFRGRFDNRQVRCVYNQLNFNATHDNCYCRNMSLVKSPLRNFQSYSSLEDEVRSISSSGEADNYNDKAGNNSNHQVISRVRQKFIVFNAKDDKSLKRYRKATIRRFGHHSTKIPEEDSSEYCDELGAPIVYHPFLMV